MICKLYASFEYILGDLRMLDRTDRRLLRTLQQNGAMTAQEMGRHLGLSTSQAGRRRQKLEQTGVLRAVQHRYCTRGLRLISAGVFDTHPQRP